MAELTEDIAQKVAANAAEEFVKHYYAALNSSKGGQPPIASFYLSPTDSRTPTISINGEVFHEATLLQSKIDDQPERSQYEVQSFDCQVLNSNYNVGVDDTAISPEKDGRKMSILVLVSGSVKNMKDDIGADIRGFSESIILVPSWDAHASKASKGSRKWLISSQTFRFVL
ncbi:related to nuclear transport factor 2 domain protein [Rhynchosporium secalis]|uniref:Related to nuclear transport factor 2 domain protein n=1 Tax=Rhynchosporium secalis TaxID=38038 RepID=A0A1E1MFL8_RHYSE|nr:related to nuclear transport factor 2 domain protein [Rhynchosporium secalis]